MPCVVSSQAFLAKASVAAPGQLGRELVQAATLGHKAEVLHFIAEGGDMEAEDEEGRTLLHLASFYDHAGSVTEALLAKGAGVHAKANDKGHLCIVQASGAGPTLSGRCSPGGPTTHGTMEKERRCIVRTGGARQVWSGRCSPRGPTSTPRTMMDRR